MAKKKSTKKKDDAASAVGDDATFENTGHQQAESAAADIPASEPYEREESRTITSGKRDSGLVAWLALFVAVLALIAFGVDFVGDRSAAGDARDEDDAVATVSSSVRAVQDSVASLSQSVTALSDEIAARDSEVAAIERRFSDRLRQIEALGGRMSAMEGTVSSLQGISTGARDAWLLAEAEYYMQIANAQLQLAGNPHLATLALSLADERILQMANPALTDIRRALSNELRSLEIMDKPDTAGVTLTLASLAAVVDSLPLRQEITRSTDSESATDTELTGTDRALESLKSAMSKAVSVRRVDETVQPLIAPEAQYFLRANLALQLQAARLAMLRGEEQLFQQSLDDAAAWLREYYNTGSTPVQSALQTIADIRDSAFTVATPDISESLRLLRQYNAFSGAVATPAIEPEEETAEEPAAEPEQ